MRHRQSTAICLHGLGNAGGRLGEQFPNFLAYDFFFSHRARRGRRRLCQDCGGTRVTAGKLNKQIAVELGISERTVKAHRSTVMEKFDVQSVAELSRIAEQLHAPSC